jgi:hypothetical protein
MKGQAMARVLRWLKGQKPRAEAGGSGDDTEVLQGAPHVTSKYRISVVALGMLWSGGAFAEDVDRAGHAAATRAAASSTTSGEESNYADAWLRVDADRVGLQLSLGATPALGAVDLALDVVVSQAYPGALDPSQSQAFNAALADDYRAPSLRLELGPALSWGGLFVLPKLGIGYDFERERVAPLVPQAIIIVQAGPAYLESWLQLFLYDLFEDGAQDSFYTRNLLLVALGEPLALGLELDATVAVQNAAGDCLRSLPFGVVGNVQLLRAFTLGLFLGYETQREARNARHDVIAGRLTATALWR